MGASAISHPPFAFLICPLDAEFQVDDCGCEVPRWLSVDHKLREVEGKTPFWACSSSPSQRKRHSFTRALSWEETLGSGS